MMEEKEALEKQNETEIKQEKKKKSLGRELLSLLGYLVVVLIATFLIVKFVGVRTEVIGTSMTPTLQDGDNLIVEKVTYYFRDPQRYDIIVFPYPEDPSRHYIKRIIGLPGETVDITNGAAYINGSETPLDEPYLKEAMIPEEDMHFEVPEDSYFMMGDNRNYSYDARYWTNTYVARDKIIAKVLFRYWPLNKIGRVQ